MDLSDPQHPICLRYRQLRKQLNAAYAAPVWDSHSIDRIALEMLPVERALAASCQDWSLAAGDGAPHAALEGLVHSSSF